jgi:uncharacterized protein (TIGR03435 family)
VSFITYAYDILPFRIIGPPRWIYEERFDVEGKAGAPISQEQRRLMLRTLLTERFQLKAHFEARNQTVYIMTVTRPDRTLGPALKARPGCLSMPCESGGNFSPNTGTIDLNGINLEALGVLLSTILGQVVRDESGVLGIFDLELSWRPDNSKDPNDARPSLFTAVEEQLGIKLTPQRRPVDVLVIDSVSRPTPN